MCATDGVEVKAGQVEGGPSSERVIIGSDKLDPAVLKEADVYLSSLKNKKEEFAYLPLDKKRRLLSLVVDRMGDSGVAEKFAEAAMAARKIEKASPDGALKVAENMIIPGALIAAMASKLQECLLSLERKGCAPKPKEIDLAQEFAFDPKEVEGLTVKTYDMGTDPFLKIRSIVMNDESDGGLTQAAFYRKMLENSAKPEEERSEIGTTCVVLGAGNQPFLAMSDVVYHMFVQGSCVILKHHPLQVGMKETIDYMFQPLIEAGYLISVVADIPLTQALVYSDHTDVVHLTGGVNTHDALVWGTEDPETRKANNEPILKARMTSELGAVSPYIVVPSAVDPENKPVEWTSEMIHLYAKVCAVAMVDNNGCNCLSCKIVILPSDPQFESFSDQFTDAFKAELEKLRFEPAWYPGIEARYNKWMETMSANAKNVKSKVVINPEGKTKNVGNLPGSDFVLPYAIVELSSLEGLEDESFFKEEPFAPVCTIIRLPGTTASEYADAAFKFSSERLWGNLSASLLMPPSAFPSVIPKVLRGEFLYGAVCINCPTFYGYQVAGYWGAPRGGSTLQDPQSGLGEVCNAGAMFDTPRNSIALVPWGKVEVGVQLPLWVARPMSKFIPLGLRALLPSFLRKAII